jgi:signal transduction histidine kinase
VNPHPEPAEGWRRLQVRVIVLIAVGVLGPLAALGAASWASLSALSGRLAEERQLLAASFAGHVDNDLRANLELLQGVAAGPRVDLSDEDVGPEFAALRAAILHAHVMRAIVILDADGNLVAEEPVRAAAPSSDPVLRNALHEVLTVGRPTVTNLVSNDSRHTIYLLVPIHDWRGHATGVVVGELDPTTVGFAGLLRSIRLGRGTRVDLVDGRGQILATTEAGRQFTISDEAGHVEALLGQEPEEGTRGPEVATRGIDETLAIARVTRAPWAIVMREQSDESLGAVTAFRRRLLLLGPLLIGLGGLFAWGAARSITRPIVVLTRAAERIGSGELDEPIPPLGRDEVGRLGQALEAMRHDLQCSLADVERANAELEQRVEERTQELAHLNRALQAREQWRGQLLSRVIVAQEDERKRIARELHDETSQTLSVLAMGLETACATLPDGQNRARLLDAKALTVRALDELHRLIYDLRPSILDDLGLLPAIRWFAARHLTPLGITVRTECADLERRLPPEMAIALFRVVQEAINNIAKHAEAETVLIQCGPTDGELVIEIEDDGRGFEPAAVSVSDDTARGLGLLGMRERVELVGGRLTIDAAPGRGAHITVRVPIPKEGANA